MAEDWLPDEMDDGNLTQASADLSRSLLHLSRLEHTRAKTARRPWARTTTAAILTTATVVSLALSNHDLRQHGVVLAATMLVTALLWLDVRCLRRDSMVRARMDLIEVALFAGLLWPNGLPEPASRWEAVAADLRQRLCRQSLCAVVGQRLRRVYGWLYAILLLVWTTEIALRPQPVHSVAALVTRASVGPIPGWLTVWFVFALNGTAILLALVDTYVA